MDPLDTLVEEAINERVFPGCVVAVTHRGSRHIQAFGRETYDDDAAPVRADALYDLASVTKSVVTATLALQCIDEGRLSLDDRIATHIPEFRTPASVRHLLTYTLGNSRRLSRMQGGPEEIARAIRGEVSMPGIEFSYSNTPAYLLGEIIQKILDMPLHRAAHARIFAPLNMRSATFFPRDAIPTEEGVRGIVHDESARVFARAGRSVGHAGLFAHASDLLNYLEHVLRQRDERHTTNQIPDLGISALGWELDQPWMGERRSQRTFGKTGFTGTSILCDPDRDLAIVILSNRTYPRRPSDNSAITAFRKNAHDMIRASV